VFLALRARGAKDWRTGLKISLTHWGNLHYIEHHHVFPKALLRGRYEQREINELANMAFTSGNTNRRIGKKKPAEYLRRIVQENGDEALVSHAVPLDQSLHEIDRYRDFLDWRRRALAECVNAFLERARQAPGSPS